MYILELSRGLPSTQYPMNGIFEFDQAKALQKYGHKVVFLSLDIRSFRRKREFGLQVTEKDGVTCFNFSFPLGNMPLCLRRLVSWHCFKKAYKKIVRQLGIPNIVHAHFGRFQGWVAFQAKKKYKLPYIVTEHESTIFSNRCSKLEKKRLNKIYLNAKCNIAVSLSFADFLRSNYDGRFEYVPNIVDLTAFTLKDKLIHNDDFILVSVGSLIERKNFQLLINAVARSEGVKLKLVGTGPCEVKLINLVKELGIHDRVQFLGEMNRNEINCVFQSSDCFILLSKNEPFGVAYIEAMATGLPVIATRCGGPESFITAENGLLVDADLLQVANAIKYMKTHSNDYCAKEIRSFCLLQFSPDVIAEKITSVL